MSAEDLDAAVRTPGPRATPKPGRGVRKSTPGLGDAIPTPVKAGGRGGARGGERGDGDGDGGGDGAEGRSGSAEGEGEREVTTMGGKEIAVALAGLWPKERGNEGGGGAGDSSSSSKGGRAAAEAGGARAVDSVDALKRMWDEFSQGPPSGSVSGPRAAPAALSDTGSSAGAGSSPGNGTKGVQGRSRGDQATPAKGDKRGAARAADELLALRSQVAGLEEALRREQDAKRILQEKLMRAQDPQEAEERRRQRPGSRAGEDAAAVPSEAAGDDEGATDRAQSAHPYWALALTMVLLLWWRRRRARRSAVGARL